MLLTPVVVHLPEEPDHGRPPLVVLGVVDLHAQPRVLQSRVNDVRRQPLVVLHQARQQRGHVPAAKNISSISKIFSLILSCLMLKYLRFQTLRRHLTM